MRAFVFDLGDTLVEYEGVPLNWESRYPDALQSLARSMDLTLDAHQIEAGAAVLRKYNTRLNARAREVTFSAILDDLLESWKISSPTPNEIRAATAFFHVFRQRLRCFPETKATLENLRQSGAATGIFTDVPYGMPQELVIEDIHDATLDGLTDVLLTSRDVGYRKPRVETIAAVARGLNCAVAELTHVGNEKKDIDVALALGCRAVLINRSGREIAWGQHQTITSLLELVAAK